jgi:hypothetical protein
MGFSKATLKVLENVYWVVSAFLLGAGIYITWKRNKQIEAVLLTIIGFSAIFYYWIKWFKIKSDDALWPPYINPCPDYLTLVSPMVVGGKDSVCMDFVGVSRQPKVFKKAKSYEIPQASEPDFESFIFKPEPQGNSTPEEYNKLVCLRVQSKGLTWAGVCE